jgi:hypothetical protein
LSGRDRNLASASLTTLEGQRLIVHHTEFHRDPNRLLWQGLIYLSTAGLGLVLYRLADVPLVVAILAGFVAAIGLATVGHLLRPRDRNHHSKQ